MVKFDFIKFEEEVKNYVVKFQGLVIFFFDRVKNICFDFFV